ncbi:MAG: carboxypeptidase regulatory-like domain-containing protein [Acidimicrobiia bacterium]|nr:carboxypeptidase regulatory-like domain-containing protein [Acidimicrobiia bacterium]
MTRTVWARRAGLLVAAAVVSSGPAWARPATPAPPLPAPTNTVVRVSTERQLQRAVQDVGSDTTILIAPGTYRLTSTLYFNRAIRDVTLRGATDDRDDVVLLGPGMRQPSSSTPFGVWTGGGVVRLTIANLTLRDFPEHPIILNPGTESPRVYNVRLVDAGDQFIKSNPAGNGTGVNGGIVEYSVIEYTTVAGDSYTNGVDVHTGIGWIIRHNLFRNIVAPGDLAGPAVLMWNHSAGTVTEGNVFINCARAISYGLINRPGGDHTGGVIRNNVIFRAASVAGDVGIHLAASANTQVLNNTVYLSGTYPTPIEYRYAQTSGVVIANNLVDGVIRARDGATGRLVTNVEGVQGDLFVDAAAGDLHLAPTAASAIDRGTVTSEVTEDMDGEARPAGGGYDIGADERGGSTTAYQLGGRIIDMALGAAMPSVTVTLTGARYHVTSTDALGRFLFPGLAAGVHYVVTPGRSGFRFTPGDAFFPGLSGSDLSVDFEGWASGAP